MLSQRLQARQEGFEVNVLLGIQDIHRYTWDPDVLDPFLAAVQQSYMGQIARSASSTIREAGIFPSIPGWEPPLWSRRMEQQHEEDRTEVEFLGQVRKWTVDCRAAFPDVVRGLVVATQPPAQFAVQNLCGRFLEEVEVEVHIEGPVSQHPKPAGRVSGLGVPTPPRKWGPWIEKSRDWCTVAAVNPSATLNRPAKPNSTSFRNSGSVTAVLRCKELRPWTTHTFTPTDDHRDIVLLASDLDIAAVDITSTATARGINGNFVTETTHPVAPPVDLTELIRLRLDQIRVAYARADG